jgi:hypothetical protein
MAEQGLGQRSRPGATCIRIAAIIVISGMPCSLRSTLRVALFALLATPFSSHAAQTVPPVAWKTQWNQTLFAQAAREHRFVLLDLHAVWCHWCHVMDEETYADPKVRTLIGQRYVAVSIDADSDPNLTSRYGDWGWPATIVLAADGTEIVKRRGFIPAAQMASLLQAIIDDPTPGPRARRGPSSQYPRRGSHARTTDCTPEALRGSLRFRARRLGHGSTSSSMPRHSSTRSACSATNRNPPSPHNARARPSRRISVSSIRCGAACTSIRMRRTGSPHTSRSCSRSRPMTCVFIRWHTRSGRTRST